jgi:hypothetical protein
MIRCCRSEVKTAIAHKHLHTCVLLLQDLQPRDFIAAVRAALAVLMLRTSWLAVGVWFGGGGLHVLWRTYQRCAPFWQVLTHSYMTCPFCAAAVSMAVCQLLYVAAAPGCYAQ